ncbi:MAG TPA: hypothetical protein VGC21_13625 [Telluria sp.]|jgi:hypothetical protein
MIISYAKIEGTKVVGFFEADDEGPNDVDFPHQATAMPVTGWPAADSPTKELHIDSSGALYWVETAALAQLKAAAIAKTYKDVDAIYDDAIGRRATEYKEAEEVARAFAVAGFAGPVSAYVSSYALYNPTGVVQTNRWAAEQIIARADAFLMAQSAMRATRFAKQAQMQAADNEDDLVAAAAAWDEFIAVLRGQLGL